MTAPAGTLELAQGQCRVLVSPETGGAIARYTWRDVDILRPAPDSAIRERQVRLMACYPLVPYSNRIALARLPFAGAIHELRPNFPPERHAIHGVGWQRPWRVRRSAASGLELELEHAPGADWPFRFEAWESFTLSARGLELRLGIRNTDARAMPAGLGWHPYFPVRPELRLQAEWLGVWKMGEGSLPTEHAPVPPEFDFRIPRLAAGWKVDHCFTGWKRHATLDYADHRVELEAGEALDRIVCFAPGDGRDFVALEPVSHVNNAFTLAAAGRRDTGMRVLAPGDSWEVAIAITARDRPGP